MEWGERVGGASGGASGGARIWARFFFEHGDEHEYEYEYEHEHEEGTRRARGGHELAKGENFFVREGHFNSCGEPEFSESTSQFAVAPHPLLSFTPNRARAQ